MNVLNMHEGIIENDICKFVKWIDRDNKDIVCLLHYDGGTLIAKQKFNYPTL